MSTDNCNSTTERCNNTLGSFECLCNTPSYRGTAPNCQGNNYHLLKNYFNCSYQAHFIIRNPTKNI